MESDLGLLGVSWTDLLSLFVPVVKTGKGVARSDLSGGEVEVAFRDALCTQINTVSAWARIGNLPLEVVDS